MTRGADTRSRLARSLRSGSAVSRHALRRVRRHPVPALLLVLALSIPVAVIAGIPLYADAATGRLLDDRLGVTSSTADGDGSGDAEPVADDAPSLDLRYSLNRLSGGRRGWPDVAELDALMLGDDPAGLPVASADRVVETRPFALIRGDERLATVSFTAVTGFDDRARTVDGDIPETVDGRSVDGDVIPVVVERGFAETGAISVGDRLAVVTLGGGGPATVEVEVAAVWTDGAVAGPFGPADAFRSDLIVPISVIADDLSTRFDELLESTRWSLELDRAAITADSVASILRSTDRLTARAEILAPGTRELNSPAGLLRALRDDQRSLEAGLRSFSLPLLVLALGVGALVVGIVVGLRDREFAQLRRRGDPPGRLLGGAFVEAVIVAAGASLLGVVGARLVATVLGRTATFFRFTPEAGPPVDVGAATWRLAALSGIGLVLLQCAVTGLALRRASPGRRTERAGSDRPWWQRSYLDVVAVLVIAFVTWRGLRAESGRAALLDDPAVVLLPSIAAVAAALLVVRVAPEVMRALASLLERTRSAAALTAARRAARVPGELAAPLVLLVVTASLATFTASLAVTLDRQLVDEAHHRIGSRVSIVDTGRTGVVAIPSVVVEAATSPIGPSADERLREPPTADIHVPLAAYADLWGVNRASPIVETTGSVLHDDGAIPGVRYVGVDPVSFADLSFWRSDYADVDLDTLMARLAANPDGALITGDLARRHGVQVGETIRLDLRDSRPLGRVGYDAEVVGVVDQFPRWSPDDDVGLVIGRADTLAAVSSGSRDRLVLVDLDARFDERSRVAADVANAGGDLGPVRRVENIVDRARTDPGRQGVLGLLTLGVALAVVLTFAGFVVTTVTSFRRRSTELGVLRAMGLSRREMTTLALFDLVGVMTVALVAAVVVGVGLGHWFIPELVDTPPGTAPVLLAETSWSSTLAVAAGLGGLVIASAVVVIVALRRVRAFEAIRLGES
ncbi:MAG: FtsX-like permease family protein [Actinomycetota bacterium]